MSSIGRNIAVHYNGCLGNSAQAALNKVFLRANIKTEITETKSIVLQHKLEELFHGRISSIHSSFQGEKFGLDSNNCDSLVLIKTLNASNNATECFKKSIATADTVVDCALVSTDSPEVVDALVENGIKNASFITPRLPYSSNLLLLILACQSMICQMLPYSSSNHNQVFSPVNLAFGESMNSLLFSFQCKTTLEHVSLILQTSQETERGKLFRSIFTNT